jgi:hypothetical protein
MRILRKLVDLLLQLVAVGTMVAIVALTAMQAATLQAVVMLLGAGLMTLALSEQVSKGL